MKKIKLLLAALAAMVTMGAQAQSWTGNAVAEGTFYLYNVGAEKFLNNGDPNSNWGTNAYLQEGFGMDVVLASKDDGYTIDTNVSNGGDSHYLANSTWCDGAATTWEFRAVDGETNVYQIIFNGQYLMANEALNDVEMVGDPGSRTTSTYWKLVSEDDFKAAMQAKAYSTTDPMDVSIFIKGRSFARNDGRNNTWVKSYNGGNWVWIGATDNKYYGNESWNNTFDVHQTITGLPEGTYEVRCSGFGTNGTTYVYGNTTSGLLQTDNTTSYGTNKEAKWKAIHEDNAFAGQSSGTFTVGDGNLTVGIKRERNQSYDWAIWDEFRLYYYGLDLSEFETALANAVTAAQATEGTIPSAFYENIAAAITENNKTYTTAAAYQTAINAINSAVATYASAAIIADFARYNSVKAAILAINDGIDLSTADSQLNAATTTAGIDEAVTTARAALCSYLDGAGITDAQIDLTAALIDNAAPGIAGNTNYWENSGSPSLDSQLFEYWQVSAGTTKQTIATTLPAGYYTLTAIAYTRDNMVATLHAGTNTMNLVGCGSVNLRSEGSAWIAEGNGVNELTFELPEAMSNLEIGLTADNTTGDHWMCWRSFKLEYLGTAPLVLFQQRLASAVETAEAHATALSGTIPAAALTAYNNAISAAAETNSTIAECNQSMSDIEATTAAADALVDNYAAYLNAADDAAIVGVASTTISGQNDAVALTTAEADIDACTKVLRDAIAAITSYDITSYTITNPSAQTKDDWEGTDFGGASDGVVEYWNKSGADFHQTVSLPAGTYCLKVVALQRAGCTGTIYANDKRTIIAQVDRATANSRSGAANWFAAGNGVNTVYFTLAEAGDVTIGLTADATTDDHWTVWKSFALETFTETAAASYLKPGYDDAMAAAVAYQTVDMFDADKTALNNAITDNTVEEASATIAAYEAAIANLNAAAAAAAIAVANYTQYSAVVAAIGENTDVDLTSFVSNADFELNNLNGWTSNDGGTVANNGNFNSTYFVERWTYSGGLAAGSLTHDAIVVPAGLYRISADAQNIQQHNGEEGVASEAGTGLFLCANDEQTEIGAKGNYAVYIKVADKTPLTIKFLRDNCTGNWVAYDNVTLTYIGEDYVYALVDGKMNATVAAAQTAAETAFTDNKNGENYQALMDAIAAAQASKDAYATAGAAIANANALKDAHNFATSEAITTFADAIAAIETPYNEGTLADADAANAGLTLGTLVTGWHDAADAAAVNFMENAFGLNDFDAALYVNTWSNEGESDGSNFKVPFYEYFAGDGNSLSANTWTATLTGLENGLYSVSTWVRVRTKNAETAVADLTGITMDVNGGTAVDVTEGDRVGESRFQLKEYTAEGFVKNGELNLNINIDADNNIHWLSFKNIKYTKVRDLTDEEMAVVPTAIALFNGEDEVTEPIALDKTNNSVTLTPSYTPADATEGYINWTSSDESVATVSSLGEVTAVLPGTATITATSTLDNTVSATATVTVTYPESDYATSTFINEGATRTVTTLGENLIKNGSLEYPNALYGWTAKNTYTEAANASNFTITANGGVNDGTYVTTNAGSGGEATSLSRAIPVEAGKKYYFAVYTSGKAPTSANLLYNALFKLKNDKSEDGKLKEFEWPQGANNTTSEWSKTEYVFTADADHPYVGVRMSWNANSSFDNFVLAEITSEETIGNVQYALDAIPTENIGEGAFQYSQNAIDDANALEQGTATVAEVEAAYEALTTLNAPEETQAYNLVFNCDGHSADGNALTLIPNPAQTQGLYGLKYLAPANVNLAQAFYFVHTTGNKYKIYAIDNDLNQRYITTQAEGYGTTWYDGIRTIDDASKAMEIEIRPNGEGLYLLWNTGANKPLAHNGNNNNDLFTNNTANFQLVETSKPSITINTTDAGWGTVILPFAQALPEGVKAYSVDELDGDKLTLNIVDGDLEANKPYIIEGAWEEIVTGDAQGTALNYKEALLTGVYESQEATEGTYILQKQGEKVGFFLVDYTDWAYATKPQVNANRAYLTVPGAGVKAFYLGDIETAIKSVFDGVANGDIYDLNGRKVQKLQKGGVYIVNGKKVSVK